MRVGLPRWIGYYNADRPHSGLAGQTPDETYGANENLPVSRHAPTLAALTGGRIETRDLLNLAAKLS